MVNVKILDTDQELASSFSVMKQLRPHLQRDSYLHRIRKMQRDHQYRLLAVLDQKKVVALAGFRIAENLAWGRYMYVMIYNRRKASEKRICAVII